MIEFNYKTTTNYNKVWGIYSVTGLGKITNMSVNLRCFGTKKMHGLLLYWTSLIGGMPKTWMRLKSSATFTR
mgnify:CR=1 FL=1